MIRRILLATIILLASCTQERREQPSAPVSRVFAMQARDRHLRGLEEQLVELGFTNTARIYDGPEFALVSVRVKGSDAIASWRRLRNSIARTQAWPVIIGETSGEAAWIDHIKNDSSDSVEKIIRAGEALNFAEWRAARRSADPETYARPRPSWWRRAFRKRCVPNHQFTIHTDITVKKPYPQVSILLVPTTDSWQVPAFLQYGGWNDCPFPSEHVSALRSWHERFGAELVGLGTDVVELTVPRPVTGKNAFQVADEQFVYCYDIVHQGTETIDCLADEIDGASTWFFWWD